MNDFGDQVREVVDSIRIDETSRRVEYPQVAPVPFVWVTWSGVDLQRRDSYTIELFVWSGGRFDDRIGKDFLRKLVPKLRRIGMISPVGKFRGRKIGRIGYDGFEITVTGSQ